MFKKAKYCWTLSTNFSVQPEAKHDQEKLSSLAELAQKLKFLQNSYMGKWFHETELLFILLVQIDCHKNVLCDWRVSCFFIIISVHIIFMYLCLKRRLLNPRHCNFAIKSKPGAWYPFSFFSSSMDLFLILFFHQNNWPQLVICFHTSHKKNN